MTAFKTQIFDIYGLDPNFCIDLNFLLTLKRTVNQVCLQKKTRRPVNADEFTLSKTKLSKFYK